MNQTTIIGNVCHNPELRMTQSGKDVCSFDVAVNKMRNGEKQTTYFRVNAWNKLAGICKQYASKGKKLMVQGEVSARAYTNKSGELRASLELTADEVEFLTPREQGENPSADPRMAQTMAEQAQAAKRYMEQPDNGWQEIEDDSELPF